MGEGHAYNSQMFSSTKPTTIMKKFSLIALFLASVNFLHAEAPFQLSLVPDVAIVPKGAPVRGVAINAWGENQVNGINLGLVNGMVGDSAGLSISFLGTYAQDYTGVLWGGFIARTTGNIVGWQSGMINLSEGSLLGLQSGLANISNDVTGLQWGLVNYTRTLNGIQIGLANIVTTNPWFSGLPGKLATGFPFVNWSF
jgi:hypothetical protein